MEYLAFYLVFVLGFAVGIFFRVWMVLLRSKDKSPSED